MTEVWHITVHTEQDTTFWAEVTELPGCFASGHDLHELFQALAEAMRMWMWKSQESPK